MIRPEKWRRVNGDLLSGTVTPPEPDVFVDAALLHAGALESSQEAAGGPMGLFNSWCGSIALQPPGGGFAASALVATIPDGSFHTVNAATVSSPHGFHPGVYEFWFSIQRTSTFLNTMGYVLRFNNLVGSGKLRGTLNYFALPFRGTGLAVESQPVFFRAVFWEPWQIGVGVAAASATVPSGANTEIRGVVVARQLFDQRESF